VSCPREGGNERRLLHFPLVTPEEAVDRLLEVVFVKDVCTTQLLELVLGRRGAARR
jgi:hypothetical protein